MIYFKNKNIIERSCCLTVIYSRNIDKKWQEKWKILGINKFNAKNIDKKFYCMEMFAYPSGSMLHLGHWFNFAPADSYARMKKMQGYEVFQPMGFDAFGLPAENYAIKTGIHPKDSTMKNVETMKRQLEELGAMFDSDSDVVTCTPEYYKWTQWLFLQLYKNGLAYRKEAPVNFCSSCKTVLANEQVIDGKCERCSSEVVRKNLTQWFFKITKYADELLEKLDSLDWPEKTKKNQKNWIGRSEGYEVTFKIHNSDLSMTVFTTRLDTLMGVTYCVIAPESHLVDKITTDEQRSEVDNYIKLTSQKTEIERLSNDNNKTGVFTGAYTVHPITEELIPIYIADYVLDSYGTGCVMAVPAHDERDFAFAKKYNLGIKQVISKDGSSETQLPYAAKDGILINSGEFNGLNVKDAAKAIASKLCGSAVYKVNYRLRDWLVSRQRYWGAPIPIIHCENCGIVPVSEKDLPVLLPYDVEFSPNGESPLKKCDSFMNVTCPKCGANAKRDPDTLDTFVCSSWYYLRYPDSHNSEKPFDPEIINKMLPVDKYIGGPEHAVMHLLYARFITKALRDMGFLNFDEPFLSLVHQGLILGEDGSKMSKSKGNTVSPDNYVNKYGSDVFRLHLMFAFAYTDGGPWSDDGIKAINRFISRIENVITKLDDEKSKNSKTDIEFQENELIYKCNETIKGVTADAEKFQFNTVVAKLMELLNQIYEYDSAVKNKNMTVYEETIKTFVKLLAPFAPHFCEEMWERLHEKPSIFKANWPEHKDIAKKEIEIVIQLNGKVRHKLMVENGISKEELEKIALSDSKVISLIDSRPIKKVICVKNKLVNIVV